MGNSNRANSRSDALDSAGNDLSQEEQALSAYGAHSYQGAYDLWQQQIGRLASLRWRLTAMLGFILLCTLVIISLVVATFVRNTERNTWLERQDEAAEYTAQSVANLVEQVSTALNLINAFELTELETEADILRNILRNTPSVTEVAYFNARGTVVAQASLDNLLLLRDSTVAIEPPQEDLLPARPGVSQNGKITSTPWFEAAQQGNLYFNVAQFSANQALLYQQQYLLFAMPATNQSVIAARVHISTLYQLIADSQFGNSGRAYVFNQQGAIITHSNRTLLEEHPTLAGRAEFHNATTTDEHWHGSYLNFEGVRVAGVSAPVPGTTWVVMTEVPRSEIFAATRRAYFVLGGGMLAFVILMMWVSAEWMEGLILTPIERLRDGAERIGRGDLAYRMDAIHRDEIGQVALTFNHMATELQDLYEDLEQKITERTEQLEEQTKELARSNAELAQFAYIASHDLQEPLRMISTYLQLLDHRYRGQLDSDADEFIAYAVDGAMRMQQLIRDLLAYSRVGRQTQTFSTIDMHQLVTRVLDDLQMMIQDRNATVTIGALPQVTGDAIQLGQLIQNLLSNALKFCDTGAPTVKISATYEIANREWLFAIQDNGIGIDAEYFERIFLIFQRLHTRSEYPGTGIGLAICKKIVERHSGRIWVDAHVGEGTTFYFTIPVNLPKAALPLQSSAQESKAQQQDAPIPPSTLQSTQQSTGTTSQQRVAWVQ